jgi:hypothetical protein
MPEPNTDRAVVGDALKGLLGPGALATRAKRVGEFNDKKNAPKPDRESDSPVVARGKTPVWKRVKGRTG